MSLGVLVGACLVVLAPSASHAVARTSTGARCTIVGTRGPDTLTGTRGRDVICGLGGNDRITGRGGADIIDGGTGRDVMDGGTGNDRIYGGAGNDRLNGQGGADLLRGGLGADSLHGGIGNDRIDGGVGDDFLFGAGGVDLLHGRSGVDVLYGGPGNDRIYGDGGNDDAHGEIGDDLVTGAAGRDLVSGGDGRDVVTGAGGDDELSGGAGGDDVDGGVGFNVCDAPTTTIDHQVRCVVDKSTPVIGDVSSTPSTVNVTVGAKSVRIEAHVTDDTGVKRVQIGADMARLVSGSPHDGVWAATIQVPRYTAPGARDLDVFAHDRVGRSADAYVPNAYTVVDTVIDQAMPVLRSISLSTTSVDVRSASKSITASVRVTDDLAGATDLLLCPSHAYPDGTFRQADSCWVMEQSSGTRTDSTWQATYVVPEGAQGGTWNFDVLVNDAAGNSSTDFWYGPDHFASLGPTTDPHDRAIPNGGGVFSVQRSAMDLNPPVLTSLHLDPSTVDTSPGAVEVTAEIAGTDVEGINGAALIISLSEPSPDNPDVWDAIQLASVDRYTFRLVSGTPRDGVWRATFVVPGGTPDGSYDIAVTLDDATHFESWGPPDPEGTSGRHVLTPELAPTGDHFIVANS